MSPEYLQRRRFQHLSGQPVPVLCHSNSEEDLSHVCMELSVFQFLLIVPCTTVVHHWKESAPTDLTFAPEIFINIDEIPSQPSLLQAEQAHGWETFPRQRDAPCLSSSLQPSTGLFLGDPCHFWPGEPRSGHSASDLASSLQSGGEKNLPWPAGHALCYAPQDTIGPLGPWAHCWLMVTLLSPRTLGSFSAELLSNSSAPNLYQCVQLFLPRCRTLPFTWTSSGSSPPNSQPVQVCLKAAQLSGVSATPPSSASSANWLMALHPFVQVTDEELVTLPFLSI